MGWTSWHTDRRGMIADIYKREENEYGIWNPLAKKLSGNDLWSVWELTCKQGECAGTTERYIRLDLMRNFGGGQWGHKDMTEEMYPYTFSCPLKFLDMVPESQPLRYDYDQTNADGTPKPGAKTWRDHVREYWAQRRLPRKVKDGDVYQVRDGFRVSGVPLKEVTIRFRGKRMLGNGYIRITRPFLAKNGTFLYNKYEREPDAAPLNPGEIEMALA